MHCIPVEGGCRDASWAVNAWIATEGGVAYIGDGWQLVRSVTLCAPENPARVRSAEHEQGQVGCGHGSSIVSSFSSDSHRGLTIGG